jgi:hypothetical protein
LTEVLDLANQSDYDRLSVQTVIAQIAPTRSGCL